ncbi:MAG: hypothetical protein DMF93_20900 [Acidobacteria bacterium]|nr:MAG: hypothetical protein DMF93_20900 [Acidobacteriota bacterium]
MRQPATHRGLIFGRPRVFHTAVHGARHLIAPREVVEAHRRADRQRRHHAIEEATAAPHLDVVREGRRQAALDRVEGTLQERPEKEIATADVGAFVMEELKRLDKVAYVRFASVYRHFRDINEFANELKDLLNPKEQ